MKAFLTLTVIVISTFGIVSGAVIRTLPEMQFIRIEKLLAKSLAELSEVPI